MPMTTTPSGGPQGEFSTYTPIYSQTLSSSVNGVTFSNIPTTYTDLIVVHSGIVTAGTGIRLRFNSDTNGTYSNSIFYGNGSSAGSTRESNITSIRMTYEGSGATSADGGTRVAHILSYSNATTYKTVLSRAGRATGGLDAIAGVWRSTNPIASISVFGSDGDLSAGTTVTIYGIRAAVNTKATGGDIITTDGTYWYHAFTSTGSFNPTQSLTCSVLQVAGGGAGFYGGGGAGGVLYTASQEFVPRPYTVTVGAGGTPPDANVGQIPVSGSNSTITSAGFTTLTAIGGGGGGVYPTLPSGATGASGGSGGGAGVGTSGSPSQSGGSATSGQGFRGGNTISTNSGAGGGGAGAAGADMGSQSNSGTNGGAGTNAYSSWLSATSLGVSGYLAGGGGGRGFDGRGSGGAGGGGNGDRANVQSGSAGTVNTGSGGGGGYSFTPNGWAGGSGLVIVRYPV